MPGTFAIASTTINACDANTGWSHDFSSLNAGDDFTANRREGSNLLEFDYNSTGWRYCRPASVTAFDMTARNVRLFLYYTSKAEVVFAASDSVVLRVYSDATPGTNYAEWDLTGHTNPALFPKLVADWNYFVVSGDNPTRTNGTVPTYTAIQNVELRVNYNSANSSNDPDIGIDFWYHHAQVTITAGTSAAPADFASMQDWSDVGSNPATDPDQGVIFSEDVFRRLWTAIDFGNGSTSTYFAVENEFIYNDQFSVKGSQDWRVEASATLRVGKLDTAGDVDYAINGCTLVVPYNPRDTQVKSPECDFTVDSGTTDGNLLAYATKFFRWTNITINGDCDIRECDFDYCKQVKLNNTSAELRDTKIHDSMPTELSASSAWIDDNGSYTNITTNWNNTTAQAIFPTTEVVDQDGHIFGYTEPFGAVRFEMATAGVGGAVTFQYWNGTGWTDLTNVEDETNSFTEDGRVRWTVPSNWATRQLVSEGQRYYVRANIDTVYTTNPTITQGFIGQRRAGEFQAAPNVLEGVNVFNTDRGMHFKATMTVTNYVATDNSFDLVVDNTLTITLVNSIFDKDKILQV